MVLVAACPEKQGLVLEHLQQSEEDGVVGEAHDEGAGKPGLHEGDVAELDASQLHLLAEVSLDSLRLFQHQPDVGLGDPLLEDFDVFLPVAEVAGAVEVGEVDAVLADEQEGGGGQEGFFEADGELIEGRVFEEHGDGDGEEGELLAEVAPSEGTRSLQLHQQFGVDARALLDRRNHHPVHSLLLYYEDQLSHWKTRGLHR